MISYFIKSGLCLAILLAFYHLVLEREKMHQFNRFYLLGSILFAFIAPSYTIYIEVKESFVATMNYVEEGFEEQMSFFEQYVTLQNVLFLLYFLISSLLFIRFTRNLFHIYQKIKSNQVTTHQHAKFVSVEDKIQPHTFWNYIFINKDEYKNEEIEEELFTHELAHVTQKHTFDVILLELLQILFWFNPFFFLLKKAIQLNHEFLADDKVISLHENITKYQTLLLSKASWNNEYYLASNLNYSLTKKRLLMMKTQNSKRVILLKKIAIMPLLAGLVFVFANRVEAQTKKKTPIVKEIKKESATRAQMLEYEKILTEVKKTQAVKFKALNRARYLYSLMSAKQRKDVENIDRVIPPPPPIKVINGVMVNGRKGKLPPPPPKKKKYKLVERKVLPAKEEIIVEEKEVPTLIEIREVSPEVVEEEVELRELKRVIELKEVKEAKERKEIEEIKERERAEIIIREVRDNDLREKKYIEKIRAAPIADFDQMKKEGYVFYLNGKKASLKKIKKIDHYEIQKMDVVKHKNKKGGKIYIYTK